MVTMRLYRGVEFSRDYSNVIAPDKYWSYLNKRKMTEKPVDLADLSPTDEMDIDVSPSAWTDPPYTTTHDPDYALIFFSAANLPFSSTAYFITKVTPLTPYAYRLHMVRDVWGTCAFAFNNEPGVSNPVIASASLTRSHWLANGTAHLTTPGIPNAATLDISSLSGGLRVAACYLGVLSGETEERVFMLFDARTSTNSDTILKNVFQMSNIGSFGIVTPTGIDPDGTVTGAILQQIVLVPENLYKHIESSYLKDVVAFIPDNKGTTGTRAVYSFEGVPTVYHSIQLSGDNYPDARRSVRYVGNWSSCVQLDRRRDNHTVLLALTAYGTAGALSITMNVDGVEQDLTSSLTMPIPASSANAKEFQRKISDTISLASGGIAALGSIATGNPLGIASSAVGIASTIGGMAARRDGVSLKPGGVLENLDGGGVFVIFYGDENAGAKSEELRLYGFTGYHQITNATLPLIAGDTTDPCLYLEGSLTFTESGATPSTSFSGEMAQLLKERARNGIRIWLNGYEDIAI